MASNDEDALDLYTGSGYYVINNSLRVGRLSWTIYITILKIISYIVRNKASKVLEKSDYIVYRGVRHDSYNNLSVGDQFEDPAFNSFTLDRTIAMAISNTILEIELDKNIDYIYLEADDEILSYPGFKYTVIDVYEENNHKIYVVTASSNYSLEKLKSMVDPTLESAKDHIVDSKYSKYIERELNLPGEY